MRYLSRFAALGSLALGVVAQNEALNYTVNSVQEANYLAATCTTALCTVFITEIRETIVSGSFIQTVLPSLLTVF
jgi:hypothetical protein